MDDIEDYAVVWVNMGDKPAGCITQVAMRETNSSPATVCRQSGKKMQTAPTWTTFWCPTVTPKD